jgi:large subunit ribosomal protein L21
MYAVIADRGKQYLVRPGERVRVDRRKEAVGAKVVFDRVLLVSDDGGVQTGRPTVAGVTVQATVLKGNWKPQGTNARKRDSDVVGKKLIVFKKRRRKGYRRKTGHRQKFTDLRVDRIGAPSGKD